ncbi:uncharacterized protein LOC119389511 [Rhipicephalus sanguineus]|uniref:uncharacterized protein LOC119389511 n=1 Tax=Rhipicephalus sanguineus TaxID=34632 RepID=UPI001893A81D|nr:uncharacterized protein LOC119389511 [Rhipicephalus sanguineus]
MDLLKPPEPLRLSGNLSENWKRFKQRFELFLQATAVEKAPRSDSSKVSLLLSFAGDEVLDIFNNFQYGPEESKECYDTVVQKFDAYFSEIRATTSGWACWPTALPHWRTGDPLVNYYKEGAFAPTSRTSVR